MSGRHAKREPETLGPKEALEIINAHEPDDGVVARLPMAVVFGAYVLAREEQDARELEQACFDAGVTVVSMTTERPR